MSKKPQIAIVGAGHDLEPAISNARILGRLIAENSWVLITGGRDAGVMKAANEGAKEVENSLTIGILLDREADISPAVDVAIYTATGEARNNIIVLRTDVVIACGVEGAGTASEVSLAIKNPKPVVLNKEAIRFFEGIGGKLIQTAEFPTEAVRLTNQFLRTA